MSIAPERILFKDEHLLAVNKLGGELVVAGKGAMHKLPLLNFLKKDYLGLQTIHRLDFETSGIVVFARSSAVLQSIVAGNFTGWKKTYVALVHGTPKKLSDEIRIPIPARQDGTPVAATTQYKILESFGRCSLIEATIERGRHHQIRRHMKAIGHPLLLDDRYGDPRLNRPFQKKTGHRRFFLHASRIEFPHPVTGKTIIIEAPMPRTFEQVLKRFKTQE